MATFLDAYQLGKNPLFLSEDVSKNLFILRNDTILKGGERVGEVFIRDKGLFNHLRKVRVGTPHYFHPERSIPKIKVATKVDSEGEVVKKSSEKVSDLGIRE